MNIRKLSVVATLSLLTLCGAGVVRADDDNENVPVRGANGAPLDFRLIKIGAFNPSIQVSNTGTDELAPDTRNHLTVQNDRSVQIEFHPVVVNPPATVNYRVWFCRFGAFIAPDTQNSGCVALLDPGSTANPQAPLILVPDTSGTVKGTAVFPALAANAPAGSDVWSGSFVVTRAVGTVPAMIQYVSAFEFLTAPEEPKPPIQPVAGAEVQLKGEISGLDTAAKSFQLSGVNAFKVVIDDSTRLIGRYKSIEELSDGMEVDVVGTFETDTATNTLYVKASRIRAGRED